MVSGADPFANPCRFIGEVKIFRGIKSGLRDFFEMTLLASDNSLLQSGERIPHEFTLPEPIAGIEVLDPVQAGIVQRSVERRRISSLGACPQGTVRPALLPPKSWGLGIRNGKDDP